MALDHRNLLRAWLAPSVLGLCISQGVRWADPGGVGFFIPGLAPLALAHRLAARVGIHFNSEFSSDVVDAANWMGWTILVAFLSAFVRRASSWLLVVGLGSGIVAASASIVFDDLDRLKLPGVFIVWLCFGGGNPSSTPLFLAREFVALFADVVFWGTPSAVLAAFMRAGWRVIFEGKGKCA